MRASCCNCIDDMLAPVALPQALALPEPDKPEQASVKAGADAAKSLLGGIGAAVGKAAAAAEASVAAAAAAGKDPSTDGKLPEQQRRPNFVKHINKTRTMSGKQKWDWAFDKILMVSHYLFFYYTQNSSFSKLVFSTIW